MAKSQRNRRAKGNKCILKKKRKYKKDKRKNEKRMCEREIEIKKEIWKEEWEILEGIFFTTGWLSHPNLVLLIVNR